MAPLALAVLSASGYHYSALQLQTRLQATGWLIVLLAVGGETLMRWLYIARRRMAYQQAVEERLAERRARHALAERAGEPEESVLEFADVEVGEPEVNVEDLQEQAAAWCVLRLAPPR
jgi:potassium-dependent mechanosensitive channel